MTVSIDKTRTIYNQLQYKYNILVETDKSQLISLVETDTSQLIFSKQTSQVEVLAML